MTQVRVEEAIEEFGRSYLSLVYHTVTISPLGPPNIALTAVVDGGKRILDEQQDLMDKHQLYMLGRDVQVCISISITLVGLFLYTASVLYHVG